MSRPSALVKREECPPTPRVLERWVGYRRGARTVVAVLASVRYGRGWKQRCRLRCDCGAEDVRVLGGPREIGDGCVDCGRDEQRAKAIAAARERGRARSAAVQRERLREVSEYHAPDFWREDGPEARAAEAAIAQRFGRLSLSEIGALYGVSRERIRQIEAEALEKLRHELERAERRAARRRAG